MLWRLLRVIKQEKPLMACVSLHSMPPNLGCNHIRPHSWCCGDALLPPGIQASLFFTCHVPQPPVKNGLGSHSLCKLPQWWTWPAPCAYLCQNAYVILYLAVVCPCHKNVSSCRVRPLSFICRSLMGPVNKIRPPQMSAIEECLHHNDTSG